MKVRLWATTRIDGINQRAGALVDVDETLAQRIVNLGLGTTNLNASPPAPAVKPKAKAPRRKGT
jgi:hypothetical protein